MDIGPGAGEHGGQVVHSGTVAQLKKNTSSLTGKYLSGKIEIPVPALRRKTGDEWVTIRGAREHNLKEIDETLAVCCRYRRFWVRQPFGKRHLA